MQDSVTVAPSIRFLVLLAALGILGLACFLWDWVALIWLALLLGLLSVASLEFYRLSSCQMSVQDFSWSHQPTVQKPFTLTVRLLSNAPHGIRYTLETIESDIFASDQETARLSLQADTLSASWELLPRRRGSWEWPGANIRYKTMFGLVQKYQRLEPIAIPVYPKLTMDLQNQLNPEFLMEQNGLKVNRSLRADQDFESLRPYVLGDNYRHIDWKASARMTSLITRQFQVEHHHHILVCLDTSRLMGTTTEGISKLDWAIEACLHLAYLAARFQDRMGLLVFSNEIDRWVKPMNHPVETFLHTLYDVESKVVDANLYKVCTTVLTAQKKRSLVIFLSDFLDASSLEPSLNAFSHLNRKHCSLFVGIEDPVYKKHLEQDNCQTALELSEKIVAQDSMARRQAVLQQLRQLGLRTLTVSPENLVQRLMQAYLEIKFQGAI